jgi:hypothetical protein
MRVPRMTTRRWMIAAMAIALALGCYREAIRLKQKRAACLMWATWHAEEEAYRRRLSLSQLIGTDLRGEADQEPNPTRRLSKYSNSRRRDRTDPRGTIVSERPKRDKTRWRTGCASAQTILAERSRSITPRRRITTRFSRVSTRPPHLTPGSPSSPIRHHRDNRHAGHVSTPTGTHAARPLL